MFIIFIEYWTFDVFCPSADNTADLRVCFFIFRKSYFTLCNVCNKNYLFLAFYVFHLILSWLLHTKHNALKGKAFSLFVFGTLCSVLKPPQGKSGVDLFLCQIGPEVVLSLYTGKYWAKGSRLDAREIPLRQTARSLQINLISGCYLY